jgi:hypothetical protein
MTEEYEKIELVLGTDMTQLMESRGILPDEVKMVIHEAEATGVKLVDPDSNMSLAKKRIADTTYFVVYKPTSDSAFEVETTYCCKTEIVEE